MVLRAGHDPTNDVDRLSWVRSSTIRSYRRFPLRARSTAVPGDARALRDFLSRLRTHLPPGLAFRRGPVGNTVGGQPPHRRGSTDHTPGGCVRGHVAPEAIAWCRRLNRAQRPRAHDSSRGRAEELRSLLPTSAAAFFEYWRSKRATSRRAGGWTRGAARSCAFSRSAVVTFASLPPLVGRLGWRFARSKPRPSTSRRRRGPGLPAATRGRLRADPPFHAS